jgi:hypothetical protein
LWLSLHLLGLLRGLDLLLVLHRQLLLLLSHGRNELLQLLARCTNTRTKITTNKSVPDNDWNQPLSFQWTLQLTADAAARAAQPEREMHRAAVPAPPAPTAAWMRASSAATEPPPSTCNEIL